MMLLTESKKQKMHRAAVADGGGEARVGIGIEAVRQTERDGLVNRRIKLRERSEKIDRRL